MPLLPLVATAALSGSAFEARAKDWRMGTVVYQIFVDRFAPSENLEAKRSAYAPPKRLHPWTDLPKPGSPPGPNDLNWSHEFDFWGGDINSIASRIDYIRDLGAETVYLTPIFSAGTNHKYDTIDYHEIAPEFGTRQDLKTLTTKLHRRSMKLVLDGVFNHIGAQSSWFQEAKRDPKSPRRDWFFFDAKTSKGYKSFAGVGGLPLLRVENPAVRNALWNDRNSVVRQELRDGIDGWRLDVAFELGPTVLDEITCVAHSQRPGSLVVGEISGYPSDWFPSVDGVYNFAAPHAVVQCLQGHMAGGRTGQILQDMVNDAGIEPTLRSWLHLDNHDTPRLANIVPDIASRRLAMAALLTLPGSPVIYYGTELGMDGAGDPQNRAPMRWDLATADNEVLSWTKQLLAVRKAHPALRYGNFQALQTDRLLAYSRTTDRVSDCAIVVMNPTDSALTETFAHRIGWLMSWGELRDALGTSRLRQVNGMMTVSLPPRSVRIFIPVFDRSLGYSPYDRQTGGSE